MSLAMCGGCFAPKDGLAHLGSCLNRDSFWSKGLFPTTVSGWGSPYSYSLQIWISGAQHVGRMAAVGCGM